jgi:uncharacterized protein (DUF342 family)
MTDATEKAASTARIVVITEQAYDIIDEMARNPKKFEDSLTKLSRLVIKVINDIYSNLSKPGLKDEDKSRLERARRELLDWGEKVKELTTQLDNLQDDEKNKEIKRFAAFAISPDYLSFGVKEILNR